MLRILLGTDWTANTDLILERIGSDVAAQKGGRILMVPELISHDIERRLCAAAGDTASRFAEVLSFTRLARRVADMVGYGAQECLDEGGRIVAMAAAAKQLHSKLKAYAAVETRPEFLRDLVDAVDEFKRCCISAVDLREAAKQTEGALAQKLEELSLLLECYDSLCSRGKRDPRDQMTWLLEQLECGDYAASHVFYIDGFPDFTRQHMAILEHLICESAEVTVSINADAIHSALPAFEKAGATAAELVRIAKHRGVNVTIETVQPNAVSVEPVRHRLFQGAAAEDPSLKGRLGLYCAESVHQECLAAAERILSLVREGARYRDIGVVCTDIGKYRNAISMVFRRCRIPVYLSGTEEILDKTVISTVLTALEAALGGFEQREVLRYLRSALSPLDLDTCDSLENYAILWRIRGRQWHTEWVNHPRGLGETWTDQDRDALALLNEARRRAIDPLIRLQKEFQKAVNLGHQVQALYWFFETIQLDQRLGELAETLDAEGDGRSAQILNQLWEILLTALEQLYDVLGATVWDPETFTRLLRLLLGQYDVGTIPTVLDAVTAGPVSAMRCQRTKHLFVLGAKEGSLPSYGGSTGVLTDQERTALRELGVPLTGGAMDGLQVEFSEIYGVFCGASETITVSCPASQPSFVYRRLCALAGGETEPGVSLGTALADRTEAGAYLARTGAEAAANRLGLTEEYADVLRRRDHRLGTVTQENILRLYGRKLKLSASQVDKQAECRLAYFLRYGLRARERKSVTIDPAEFGTYVHAVLEETGRKVMELGGFKAVPLEQVLEIAKGYSEAYEQERFGAVDSRRAEYLFHRNYQELETVMRELWQELRTCAFTPIDFEVAFGDREKMPAIPISGRLLLAELRGYVDRVDVWQVDGQNYFRVVDYKTGRKDWDYCDVLNGLGLQMLLYLFALEEAGQPLLGAEPIPAGVQYFPARVPMVSADSLLSDEEAAAEREAAWKRKGLLLKQDSVLQAMELTDGEKRLCYRRNKDGVPAGDLADRQQFALLKSYVFRLLGDMVDEIAAGRVEPNPYTRGSRHDACAFCPYGAVCRKTAEEGRRNYKKVDAKEFWNQVEGRTYHG